MGLFKEKNCYKCGEKVGLLSGKSGDDYHICGNCLKKYSADSITRIGLLKDIPTKEEFDRYLDFCEMNRKELKDFQKTKSYFGFVQIDGYAEKLIFIDDYDFERKEKLLAINPHIYDLDKLLFFHVINKDVSDKKGILNKYIRVKQKTILGFENEWFPVACDYTVDVDLPVKEGFFKDTVYLSSEAEDLNEYLITNLSDEYLETIVRLNNGQCDLNEDIPDILRHYFEQLQNIRELHIMSSSEMDDYLKNMFTNKVIRKSISREYNL